MKLSEINRTLREIQVAPVKTLGQNFLHDQNLARWIIEQGRISAGDFVLEIGPGLGALTEPALAAGAQILAIEKDARLANFLREKFSGKAIEMRHEDALAFDVRELFPHGPTKLLGNLPYYAATELLFRFLQQPTPIRLALLMLQKEVAARLSAAPRAKDYGILTLMVQSQCRVELLRRIPPSVFVPAPEVESAVVRLVPRAAGELPEHDAKIFDQLVRRGFSQRRKQLAKLLKEIVADWPAAAAKIGASPQARAEELALDQWIALSNFVHPSISPAAGNDPNEMFQVVDENDRVIGAAPRAEVHGDNLRHRAVHIFVFNRDGELLLQKRSRWKDRHPRLWDSSAAGHVAAGEEYDATARREVKEELGISPEMTRLKKIPASRVTGEEFIWLYRAECDQPLQPAASEIEAVKFFPPALVAKWIEKRPGDFAPGFLQCWRAARLPNESA